MQNLRVSKNIIFKNEINVHYINQIYIWHKIVYLYFCDSCPVKQLQSQTVFKNLQYNVIATFW